MEAVPQYVIFSNWKNKQCDWSTNKLVHNFYNQKDAKSFRQKDFTTDKWLAVNKDYYIHDYLMYSLIQGDTLTIGVDYYGRFSMCSIMLPLSIRIAYAFNETEIFHVFIKDKNIVWQDRKREQEFR